MGPIVLASALAAALAIACSSTEDVGGPQRIAVVGASVSAGFNGRPLDVVLRGATRARVTSAASTMMFQDAVAHGTQQIDAAIAAKADLVLAIDFLFWHAYNGDDLADRVARVERGIADLERARASGARIVIGDIPRFTTASEVLIAKAAIPPVADMAAINDKIAAWARGRADVVVVPFASWAEPLAAGADVEIAPGETVPARALMANDGLHPNEVGVWYVMSRIDTLVERAFAVPEAAWRFARPPMPETKRGW